MWIGLSVILLTCPLGLQDGHQWSLPPLPGWAEAFPEVPKRFLVGQKCVPWLLQRRLVKGLRVSPTPLPKIREPITTVVTPSTYLAWRDQLMKSFVKILSPAVYFIPRDLGKGDFSGLCQGTQCMGGIRPDRYNTVSLSPTIFKFPLAHCARS